MRALALAIFAVSAAACTHYECAIDTDCTDVGTYCAVATHTCVPVGGGDAGPRDAGATDGGPHDAASEGGSDAGPMDAGPHDAGGDAMSTDGATDAPMSTDGAAAG